jgi:hypothetical protein
LLPLGALPLTSKTFDTQSGVRRVRAFGWMLNNPFGLAVIEPGKKPGATEAPGIHGPC